MIKVGKMLLKKIIGDIGREKWKNDQNGGMNCELECQNGGMNCELE